MPERLSIRGAKAKSIFEFLTACFAYLHDRLLVPGLNYGGETSVFEKLPPREKSPRTNGLRAEASQLSAMRGDLNGYYGRRAESYEKNFVFNKIGASPGSQATRDRIGLIPNPRQFVAHPGEAQHVHGVAVALQIITAPGHGFAGVGEFVRRSHARQPAAERLFFSNDESWSKTLALIQVTMSKLLDGRALLETFFADLQITVVAIAINKFGVLVNIVRLVNQFPGGRRKIDNVLALRAVVGVFLSQRVWTRSCH